jgi:polyisoprenoid-binding protein YceI
VAKHILFIIIVLLVKITTGQQVFMTRTGTASFVSNAPLEVIKARSNEVQGAIDPVKKTFAFTIDIKSFKGFNSALQQEHFYENYMEVQTYATSSFKGKIIEDIDMNSAQEQIIRAKGILEIHGVAQERIIKGTINITDGKISLNADFSILLEDHQIKVPKVVNQKIAESIEVSVTAELIRKSE